NPPYSTRIWAEMVPRYMDNLIAAAAKTRGRLVVLDNVYMLGRPNGRRLDEQTPLNPVSRKGEIRARAAERLFEAHRRGDVVATRRPRLGLLRPGGHAHRSRRFLLAARAGGQDGLLAVSDGVGAHVPLHPGCRRWPRDARLRRRRRLRRSVDAAVHARRQPPRSGSAAAAPVPAR